MPTWGEVLSELNQPENRQASGAPDFDRVRRRYLAALAAKTGRSAILYATAFLDAPEVASAGTQLALGDIQGFMNAVAGLRGKELDLIVTRPGSSAEATESIVSYLRARFDHIRVFVPVAAMSAATMLALGADEIVMGKHSQLGPIDPQLGIGQPEGGVRFAPAAEILEQFERAKIECQNPANLAAWAPILRTYSPGLLSQCVTQRELAERMVGKWMETYMFAGMVDAEERAPRAAAWFSDYKRFGSHGRRVSLQDLQELGIRASALEDDQELQDLVLSVHHATSHTISNTGAVKIIENHIGHAWVQIQQVVVAQGGGPTVVPMSAPRAPALPAVPNNRAERRRNR